MVKPILQPHATLNLGRACLTAGLAVWLLLGTGGCGGADSNLFESRPELADGVAGAGKASNAGSSGMVLSAGGTSGEGVAGGAGNAGLSASGTGCAFSCGEAGPSGGDAPGGSAGMGGVSDRAGGGSALTDCSAFAADATFLSATQHCYLVDTEQRTYAAAQAHCTDLKAHLVTLGSEAEDEFAWSIHAEEHWVGASDGKMPKQSGAGTYTWVTHEPFDYSNWSWNQPDASNTDCVGSNGGSCFEHCAFQWKGGDHNGQWNDRNCMHTIASICEWDDSSP